MTKSLGDSIKHRITCSQCSKEFEESYSRLKTNPLLTCPACGHKIQVNFKSDGGVEKLDAALSSLFKSADKLSRRR